MGQAGSGANARTTAWPCATSPMWLFASSRTKRGREVIGKGRCSVGRDRARRSHGRRGDRDRRGGAALRLTLVDPAGRNGFPGAVPSKHKCLRQWDRSSAHKYRVREGVGSVLQRILHEARPQDSGLRRAFAANGINWCRMRRRAHPLRLLGFL